MTEQTPLSADKRYPIEIIQGVEGFCIGVNNYRLVGPKPWGGGTVVKRWNVSLADLGRAIPELSATIAAQAAEIAALKGALEKVEAFCDPGELPVQPPETIAALGTEFLRGFEMGTAVAKSYLWFEVLGRRGKTLDEIKAARVLAGKGQCPKCEGRGFIRTMVDGQRDSEPCSYCRMSGLAGKEAQG